MNGIRNDFVRVAAVSPRVHLGDPMRNGAEMLKHYHALMNQGAQIIVYPEMSLTGYTIMDMVQSKRLMALALDALDAFVKETEDAVAVIGLPLVNAGRLYNCAVVIKDKQLLGAVPKCHLPTGMEFQESRWFVSGANAPATIRLLGKEIPFGMDMLFKTDLCTFAIEICEDLWTVCPPSSRYAKMGAEVLLNLSASNELVAKHAYREQLIAQQSGRCVAGYVYAGAGYGESTTDMVFAGYTGIYENGTALKKGKRFERNGASVIADIDLARLRHHRMQIGSFFDGAFEAGRGVFVGALKRANGPLMRDIDPMPFVPGEPLRESRCEEIIAIQTMALQTRMEKTRMEKIVLGVSGGLDSTLALLIAAMTMQEMGLPPTNILAVTMPGFGTGKRTYNNAHRLMDALGVTIKEVDIAPAVRQHFKDIGQDENNHDVTYENAQARERTQILMDMANMHGALVLGTGDLSEGALGFSTYNGDHMSMYNVNCSIPKTLIRTLTQYLADTAFAQSAKAILYDVVETPVSPELLPVTGGELNQKTEELLGDYALHDFFLYHLFDSAADADRLYALATQAFQGVYDAAAIKKALDTFIRRFYTQQFKRSCSPDGPKVGSCSLSPRGDLRMPSDVDFSPYTL